MASKVMMKISVAPFAQVNKTNVNAGGEVVGGGSGVGGRKPEPINQNMEMPKVTDSRVAQLEQNIKFLQEQHQMMLTGLHNEIDNLRHRNRELQFQLVFAKGSLPSSPSSPEDDAKSKVYAASPKNMTPLQVELLERDLSELKLQMQEVESRNVYLSAIVDEQKKKLERYERDRERERERGIQPDPELLRKLDDAESLIRRLRRENSDLRREQASIASASTSTNSSTYHNQSYQQNQRGGQSRGNQRHRGNSGNGSSHYRSGNWFPPLHTQFWQNGSRGVDRNSSHVSSSENTLPTLQNGGNNGGNSGQYHGRRGANNNHYSHNGEARKYRGGQNRSSKPS